MLRGNIQRNKKELSKRNTILGEIQEEMHYLILGGYKDNDFMKNPQKNSERKERKGKTNNTRSTLDIVEVTYPIHRQR